MSFDGYPLPEDHPWFRYTYRRYQKLQQLSGFQEALAISTKNSFPTGCGIASSASGMAALTLAAVCAWTGSRSWNDLDAAGYSREDIAHLARQLSGSAGRSLLGGFVLWEKGLTPDTQRLSSIFDKNHWHLENTIVVVNSGEKKVSSNEGHKYAHTSRYFELRQQSLPERQHKITEAIKRRDLQTLGDVIEEEALDMHRVMATAQTPVDYLSTETLEVLAWIRKKRHEGHWKGYFTIDAGPNVHIIHQPEHAALIRQDLADDLPQFRYISDTIGHGPSIETNINAPQLSDFSLGETVGSSSSCDS